LNERIEARSLCLTRPLLNIRPVFEYLEAIGVRKAIPPEHLHMTVATVRTPVDWSGLRTREDVLVVPAGLKTIQIFAYTIKGLTFGHPEVKARHEELLAMYPGMDHPILRPHVSLYKGGRMPHTPYKGELVFGPERAEEFDIGRAHGLKHVKVSDFLSSHTRMMDAIRTPLPETPVRP
jgi:hypothetical protein